MKEEINIINQVNNDTTPIVSLSITSLDIEVEEGRVYKDSFFIESENKIPIEGYVCTTSDKMAVEVERLEGIRQEIPFYFKGKLATADSSFEGDIVLITNGGEYTIPYSVKVIHKYIETSHMYRWMYPLQNIMWEAFFNYIYDYNAALIAASSSSYVSYAGSSG